MHAGLAAVRPCGVVQTSAARLRPVCAPLQINLALFFLENEHRRPARLESGQAMNLMPIAFNAQSFRSPTQATAEGQPARP